MNQEELISKKELLLETGISYGQLYRWKRQNLIPDAWFIKKSTFTGQETFFPKEKMLRRIKDILEMKDTYSLEELAALFSPESVNRTFVLMDVSGALGMTSSLVDRCIRVWGKHRFTFLELLFIDLLREWAADHRLTDEECDEWLLTAKRWSQQLTGADRQVLICRKKGILLFLLLDVRSRLLLDEGCQVLGTYDLEERSKELQVKLQNVLEGV
jgi:hypothetical protein